MNEFVHRYPRNFHFNYRNVILAKESFKKCSPRYDHFASAGFFYSNGFLQCCACPLRLHNWMNLKNPLIAHSILSPDCPFLLKEKGPLFVFETIHNYRADWDGDSFTCSICFAKYIDTFLDCGHLYCSSCLTQLKSCPLCKREILHYVSNSTSL